MKEAALHTIREILVAFTVVFIFLFLASSVISSYANVNIVEAFGITLTHIITLGGGTGYGNIFYFALIFVEPLHSLWCWEGWNSCCRKVERKR